jgi:hypothetical protein
VLHRYFIRPITVDRIRSSWIGDAIERYVAWLSERNYASRNVFVRVPPCSDSESLHRGLAPKPGRNFLAMLNLDTQLLIIQQTKFEKDRLVPFGPKMARAIAGFLDNDESRSDRSRPTARQSPSTSASERRLAPTRSAGHSTNCCPHFS